MDSSFVNIGYQQNLTDLHQNHQEFPTPSSAVGGATTANFDIFTNRGAIINAQGFPGPIEIRDSTFDRNMAYIKDVFIEATLGF